MTQKFSIKGFAANSITGEKIAGFTTATDGYVMAKSSGNITWQQMDSDPTMGGDMTGTASNAQLAAGVVGTTEIATDAVTANEIATGAITSGKIHNSVSMGGPSQGIGSIIRTNADVIDEDIVLASGTNGVTMGPVTITVGNTINVNCQWKVI